MPDRVGAGEEAVTVVQRRTERPVPQPRVNEDVVAAAVGDDQVEDAVVVEVRQRDGARGDQARCDASAKHGRDAADGLDDELIGELIGEDERGRRVAAGSVDRQPDLLVEVLTGLERAVAVADQDLHVAQRVADEQVGVAVAVQVGDRQAVGLEADVVLGRRQEASLAIG